MKKLLAGIIILSVYLCNLIASPVSESGALKRQGSKIVGANGNPVQVAGPSLYWSIWGGQKFYNSSVVTTVATTWNASLIRAAIAAEPTGGYLDQPANQLAYAKTVVDAAIANGIYVLVDWHDHNANLHVTQAKEFFTEMAKAYTNTPNVIWEIWNEPDKENGTGTNGEDTWDDIRNYANEVIPEIRKYSSNLIVVGTPNWCLDPASAASNPLSDTNVAYSLHFYAGTHGSSFRKNAETAMSKGAAIFITEFGTTDASGGKKDSTLYLDQTKTWLDWADYNGISWANWSLSNIPEAASELKSNASTNGNWTDNNLSTSGKWVRDRLLSRPKTQSSDSANILVTVEGSGTVTLSPNTMKVKKGTLVTFTAVPSSGWVFKSWSEASDSKDNPLALTIDDNTSLTATFMPDAGTNMIKNGDFSDTAGWNTYFDTTNSEANINFTDSQANIVITKSDTANWHIQLTQKNLNLDSGATYTIIVDAWSTAPRKLFIGLSSDSTWHFQGGEEITLDTVKTTYTITVKPDSSTSAGILQFNGGASTLPIYIDNVQMYKTNAAKVIYRQSSANKLFAINHNGNLIYWTPLSKQTKVILTDIRGRILRPFTDVNPVSLNNIPSGIYLFVVKDGTKRQAFQILK